MLTDLQLRRIMQNLAAAKLAVCLPPLNAALKTHGVDTPLRMAAFLAQLAHESGEFRWMEEIWGPTVAQRRYEPPNDLAKRLGNTEAGDGLRFKGRGPIQITGRFNYRKYGDLLGVDLIADPPRAAAADVAFETAGLFWTTNGLNELADARDFVGITKRINGGTNGLADRQMYYARALAELVTEVPRELPLTRGHEAIIAARPPRAGAKAAAKKLPARGPGHEAAPVRPTARKAAARGVSARRTARGQAAGEPVPTHKGAVEKTGVEKTVVTTPAADAPKAKTRGANKAAANGARAKAASKTSPSDPKKQAVAPSRGGVAATPKPVGRTKR